MRLGPHGSMWLAISGNRARLIGPPQSLQNGRRHRVPSLISASALRPADEGLATLDITQAARRERAFNWREGCAF